MDRKELNKCIENCCDAIVNNKYYGSADGWLEIVKLIDEYEQVKNCSIPDVSQQRELLIDFYSKQRGGMNETNKHARIREVDNYIESINCL